VDFPHWAGAVIIIGAGLRNFCLQAAFPPGHASLCEVPEWETILFSSGMLNPEITCFEVFFVLYSGYYPNL
jgi:hypothetical protein